MILFVLTAVLVLVVGGCVCVVWAARGGPRWTRGVAAVVLLGGELVRAGGRRGGGKRGSGGEGPGDGGGGSDG
ncbi:hypothetical protein GCM10010497_57060 [Streptomyces cinereoruber]|uniref:Hydrophobic protein n=1 Tax=Streptomyces cinereoruber TaxID=67260 RepID=A0AAV4KR54_9ACTN|nr:MULTISPECIES: hypothetical protein [Streptomyces]AVH95190.1 hypothetical protein C5L38_09010 [Streptomyces sp. WAC00288]MBB4158320.1 putative membrane protein YgcG [Streptomyces cinereoruber]MBY8814277.1 hypothetical protein [Streptomyces cinereoruber]NIH58981.1 putative membrane protein YgcG [Streptomyces cinereoruber]PVC73636.1 hypothetical protein DBP18_14990 [Streptomyces sp. CS081A]